MWNRRQSRSPDLERSAREAAEASGSLALVGSISVAVIAVLILAGFGTVTSAP
jgi:hypothetical protein